MVMDVCMICVEVLMKRMAEVTAEFEERSDEEKVALVLDEGCRDVKAKVLNTGK